MRNQVLSVLSFVAVAALVAGCAGPTEKFSRGLNNSLEFARLGEMQHAMEQAAIFAAPGHGGIADGFFTGVNRSVERTGAGIYEMVTAPIPNGKYGDYGPIFHPADPVYPDSYKPDWMANGFVEPDSSMGFAGGDISPFIPGSRFHIFDN